MIFLKAYFLIGAFVILITTYYTQEEIREKMRPDQKEFIQQHPSMLLLAILLSVITWPNSFFYLLRKIFTPKKK